MAVSGTGLSTLIASKLHNIPHLIVAQDKDNRHFLHFFLAPNTVLAQMMCYCVWGSWHQVTNGKLKCDRFQFAK